MNRSRVHLIGGGPGTLPSLRRHLRAALTEVGRKAPLVAYVGAASGDHPGFQKMIGAEIARAGGRVRGAKLVSKQAKASTARALLEDADVVFVSGGDVLAGMSVLADRDMLGVFHALAKEGRPMIGISAGSIMLGRAWVHFPDGDALEPPTVFPCLGIAPVYVDAHAEEDDWVELRTLLDLVALRGETSAVGYGLTRKGALRVDHGGSGAKLTAFGTATPKFIVRKRRVIAGEPLPLGTSEAVRISKTAPRRPPAKR